MMKQGRQIHSGPRDREGLLDLHAFGFNWCERGRHGSAIEAQQSRNQSK